MIGKGRRRIIIEKEINKSTLLEVVSKAMAIHQENVNDFHYLIDYYKGQQDILDRKSTDAGYNDRINNKVVVNYAYSSSRDIVGYLFSKSTQYICNDTEHRKEVDEIARTFNYENGALVDHEAATLASICGMSYLFTLPNKELLSDYMPDIPIVNFAPDIMTTFIVQSAKVGNPATLAVMYYTDTKYTYYTCYTDKNVYKFKSKGYYSFNINEKSVVEIEEEDNPIGLIPVIQVKNNQFMLGDFEVAISVLNAINQLSSDTLNDIQNVIQSLLVVIGAEITGNVVDKVKQNRILNLVGGSDKENLDAKFIYQQLDALGMQNIREYLEEAYKQIIGIPDRKTRGGGGGDTGDAVKLRDGWADIEIVARIKEQYFCSAKLKQVAVIVRIMQKLSLLSKEFSTKYIDIKLPRNTLDNLQTKAQAFSTFNGTKVLHPADSLDMVGITTDVDAKIERGQKYWEEREQHNLELEKQKQEMSAEISAKKENGQNSGQNSGQKKTNINEKQEQKNQHNTNIAETKARKDAIKSESKGNKRERIY